MAQQHINLGTPPTGADGDTYRTANQKIEANFDELYGASGPYLVGTYAARPAASAQPMRRYFASDVKELYFSDGSTWTRQPMGGVELMYVELSTAFESAAIADVPGLAISTVVGESPIIVSFGGTTETSAQAYAFLALYVDGVQVSQILNLGPGVPDASSNFVTASRETRISGLAPGVAHTFKLMFGGLSGNIARIYGLAADKAYMQIRTC